MSTYVLGINIGHDQGAAIIKDGEVLGAIAQERINRIKHTASVNPPFEAIDYLLDYFKLDISDISYMGVTSTAVYIEELEQYVRDMIKHHYHYCPTVIPFTHHLAHAASAYFTSDFDNAIAIVADGGGENVGNHEESESIFLCNCGTIKLLERRLQSNYFHALSRPQNYIKPFMNPALFHDQISIGKKYSQITNLLGFGNNGAGKTMGLAGYGRHKFTLPVQSIDGEFGFQLQFDSIISEVYSEYEKTGRNYVDFYNEHSADIAYCVQHYTEQQVIEIVRYCIKKYNCKQFVLAGGVFLNCPVNHKLLETFPDITIHICPAAGDEGQALGAAFLAYYQQVETVKKNSRFSPFLGRDYSNSDIQRFLDRIQANYTFLDNNELVDYISDQLSINKVVGIFRGRSEFGPRALCHRSILANPTTSWMKDYLNKEVKHREMFRPFAPVVIAEDQRTYFELLQESPYMLLSTQVRPEYADDLPAIVHVDGSARIQAVTKASDPFMHDMLLRFSKVSGYPILLNTSFNDRGEPIVESPHDAYHAFVNMKIDILILENFVIKKNDLNSDD